MPRGLADAKAPLGRPRGGAWVKACFSPFCRVCSGVVPTQEHGLKCRSDPAILERVILSRRASGLKSARQGASEVLAWPRSHAERHEPKWLQPRPGPDIRRDPPKQVCGLKCRKWEARRAAGGPSPARVRKSKFAKQQNRCEGHPVLPRVGREIAAMSSRPMPVLSLSPTWMRKSKSPREGVRSDLWRRTLCGFCRPRNRGGGGMQGKAGQGKVRHLLQALRRGTACSRGAVQAGRAEDCLFAIWETTPEKAGSAHHPATACRKNFARFFVRCDEGFCIDKPRPLLYSENR